MARLTVPLIPGGASAWDAMVAFAGGIETSDSSYEYELPVDVEGRDHTANSNAVILSVLNAVGVDVRTIASVVSNRCDQRVEQIPIIG